MDKDIIRLIVTEKTSKMLEEKKYVFAVSHSLTKIDIKESIKSMYNLQAISVKTSQVAGKKRRRGKIIGKTTRYKKAIVQFDDKANVSALNELIKS